MASSADNPSGGSFTNPNDPDQNPVIRLHLNPVHPANVSTTSGGMSVGEMVALGAFSVAAIAVLYVVFRR